MATPGDHLPSLGSSDLSPQSAHDAARAKAQAPLGRRAASRSGLRNRSRDADALPPGHGSLAAESTHAALAAFARSESATASRWRRALAAAAVVLVALCIFAFFAVPRVPGVTAVNQRASTTSSRADVLNGGFALSTSATYTVDNRENWFAMSFGDLRVQLANAAGAPMASWSDATVQSVPARSTRSFTVVAGFDTLSNPTAIISSVSALSFAVALTQNSTVSAASESAVRVSTSMTPVWLKIKLPRKTITFAVPVTTA